MKSPAPFVMSWNIQYLGSYTVRKITSDSLQRRMDKVSDSDIIPQFVYLSISLNGVYVATEDKPKNPFLAHSIRRICCVVGNQESRQVAYVTRRTTENGGSKKECHIFRTEISQQVEDIKAVLSSAFQRIVFVDNSTTTPLPSLSSAASSTISKGTTKTANSNCNSETTISSHRSSSLSRVTPTSTTTKQKLACELRSPSLTSTLPYTSTPKLNNSQHQKSNHRQMSAAILFQRFFGTTPKRNNHSPSGGGAGTTTTTPDCFSTTPLRKIKDSERRRKRPVSAIFGDAMRHAANTLTPKKTPSTLTNKPAGLCGGSGNGRDGSGSVGTPAVMLRDKKFALSKIQESEAEHSPKKEPELEFDEKLGEFVFPIGQFMDDQLQRLAYFCNNPNKYEVYAVLSQMPEGSFLLRYSESRRRCLALSVRVPDSYDDSKISHYLIIRNQEGFRLKGSQRYFSSLPMLITHHTVIPELLPCRLIFVEWDKNLLRGKAIPSYGTISSSIPLGYHENQYSSPPRILNLSQSPHKKHARRSFELCEA